MLSNNSVRLWRIHHPFETFMESNAEFTNIRQISYGLLAAEYRDNCIRLVSVGQNLLSLISSRFSILDVSDSMKTRMSLISFRFTFFNAKGLMKSYNSTPPLT